MIHVPDRLKPYPEYQDSSQTWLGEVPAHWKNRPAFAFFREKNVKNIGLREKTILSLSYGRIVVKPLEKLHGLIPDSFETYQVVEPGDIIIRSTDLQNDWTSLRVGLVKDHGIITSAYLCLRTTEDVIPEYGHLLLHTFDLMKVFYGFGSGLRQNLAFRDLKRMPIFIPPLDEQAAIVRFLDWANARLECAIRAKRKVIALLNEQKQTTIQQAVTCGIDCNPLLIGSNSNWFPKLPVGWQVRRLRTLIHRIDQGVSPLAEGFLAVGNSWGVLKAGCVNRGVFRQTEHKRLAGNFEIDSSIVVMLGDVLVSRACGSPQLVGSTAKVGALNYRLILSDKTFRPIFKEFLDVDFMVYAMNSRYYRRQVEQAISGAEGLANNLPLSSLRDFMFAIPPIEEAKKISMYLKSSLSRFEEAILRTEREIKLLSEYRTRLTADVVTGKLDVRAIAATLPREEPITPEDVSDPIEDESELLDELTETVA